MYPNISEFTFCQYQNGTTRVVYYSNGKMYDAVVDEKELIDTVRSENCTLQDLTRLRNIVRHKSSIIQ